MEKLHTVVNANRNFLPEDHYQGAHDVSEVINVRTYFAVPRKASPNVFPEKRLYYNNIRQPNRKINLLWRDKTVMSEKLVITDALVSVWLATAVTSNGNSA